MTEKAVKRLSELVPTYKHQLKDNEVLSNFMALAKQAKMFASREVEQAVDEWKAQLQQVIYIYILMFRSEALGRIVERVSSCKMHLHTVVVP